MAKAKTKGDNKVVQEALRRAEEGTGTEVEKGYAGTDDYLTGKVNTPGQATDEQIRADRAKQRNT